jgi:hypothetical protein
MKGCNVKSKLEQLAAEVGFRVMTLPAQLTLDDGTQLGRSIRVVLPSPEADLGARLAGSSPIRPGDANALLLACRLVKYVGLVNLRRRRNERTLDPNAFVKSRLGRELARRFPRGVRSHDVISTAAGEVTESVNDLLHKARYAEPLFSVQVDREAFCEFREQLLGELDAHAEIVRTIVAEANIPPEHQEAVVDRCLDARLRELAADATAKEKRHGPQLNALAERAVALARAAEDFADAHPRTPFRRRWDWCAVEKLIADAIAALRDSAWPTDTELAHVRGLEHALHGNNINEKAEAVRWIWANCRDRSELLEHFLIDVEHAESFLYTHMIRGFYRSVRGELDRCERRLFVLMHMQWVPMFGVEGRKFLSGGVTLFFDPVLQGAALDPVIGPLTVQVIGEKQRTAAGLDLAAELDRRLRAYLRFYGYWLELQRQEERQARKERRVRERLGRATPVDRVGATPSPSLGEHDDILAMLREAASEGNAERLLQELRIRDDDGVFRMRFIEGLSQREIAAAHGVTQQAVSAKLRRMWNAVLRGVARQRGHDAKAALPRRKWAPRG